MTSARVAAIPANLPVSVALERAFTLLAPPARAFALLADVPRWQAWFPGVEAIEEMPEAGENVYRWTMAPVGPREHDAGTVYACRYVADPGAHTLAWSPVEGVGNARMEGEARRADDEAGSAGTLKLRATLALPLPSFVRPFVEPLVVIAFERAVSRFIMNLQAALVA